MKHKRIMAFVLCFAMVLSTMSFNVFAEDATATVSSYDELVAALADVNAEKTIQLTGNITIDTSITVPDGVTIDLNDNTLFVNIENSYYNDAAIMNGNIVLGKDDVHVCDGYFLVNADKTLVLNDINMTSADGGIKGYAVFHLYTGAKLDLINSNLDIRDNEHEAGYIVYAGESTASVDITGTTVTGTNTNGIVHATTVIDNSTFTIGDAVEHGINRSAVTINDSTVTISGGTGRGITAQHGDLVITGNSVVNISDMGEATIELRGDKNLTVDDTATVTVDVAVNNTTNGTIIGEVTVEADTPSQDPSINAVAKIGDSYYDTLENAINAANEGDTITMLADVTLDEALTLPAGITFDGNGKAITGVIWAGGNLTFKGHTKVSKFEAGYNKPTITIGEGACLELTGTERMVIGHEATFNITGSIADAKTANTADLTPSLIMPGASFTGAGVNFNVKNAYISVPSSYCSSSKSASGTFNFNIENSIWKVDTNKLAFEAQSTAATVNFNLKDSVLNTASHLIFGVNKGEIVIDNSNVNVGTSRQIENRSTMTIKNGSVVNGAVATSSNAKNPGTIIVEDATYAVTGEFSGSDLGVGTIIINKNATFSAGSITKANITIDATGMTADDTINLNAKLDKFEGSVEVINNNTLEANIVDNKIVFAKKPVASVNSVAYKTLAEAIDKAQANDTITLLADVAENVTIDKNITLDGADFKYTGTITVSGKINVTVQNVNFVKGEILHNGNTQGNLTVKKCSFANGGYAVTTASVRSVTIEDCTVTNQSLLYAKRSTSEITVKNVNISGGNYVAHIVYNNTAYFENVKATAMTGYGIFTQNYGAKTITLNNCSFETPSKNSIGVRYDRTQAVDTFIFQGENSMTAMYNGDYAKYVLADADATLKAGEGYTVTAANEKHNVIYENGAYKVEKLARIGEKYYITLEDAIADAKDGDTITLLKDIEIKNSVVISNKTITLDLGQYSIYDKNTTVLTSNDNIWGLIVLKDNANLTVCGNGVIECDYAATASGWTGMAYCFDVDKTSELTVNGGTFINGNGGIQTAGKVTVNNGTFVSHNGGTCIMAVAATADVTVNDGTFKDSVENNDVYTGSGAVWGGFGAAITINGGTYDFAADPENDNVVWTLFPAQNAIAGYGENANMTVKGGTFKNFNPATDVVVDYSPSAGFTFGSVVADGFNAVKSKKTGLWNVIITRKLALIPSVAKNSEDEIVVKTNETFTVDVKAEGIKAGGARWVLNYDKTKFELESIDTHGFNVVNQSADMLTVDIADTIADDSIVATYKFKSLNDAVTKSPFELTYTELMTSDEAWQEMDVANITDAENTDITIELREIVYTATFDGEAVTDTIDPIKYDGKERKFIVTVTEPADAVITYTVNGEIKDEVSITAEDIYNITFTIEKAGYETVTKNYTVTIEAPYYEVEVGMTEDKDYVSGYKLVLVYTNAKNVGFDYDGIQMLDASEANKVDDNYLYLDKDKFDYVYALVVPAIQTTDIEDYKKKVSVDYTGKITKIDYTPEYDINFSKTVNFNDIVSAYSVLEKDENAFANYMAGVIKTDVNFTKTANNSDMTPIISKVYGKTTN